MSANAPRAALAVPLALSLACATAPAGRSGEAPPAAAPTADMDAVLWVGTSQEYRATALQAYATATAALERALADSGWTAALEQTGDYAALPPAVIVDVDESALGNAPVEASFILDHDGDFDPGLWARWVAEGEPDPVPGALEFALEAGRRGVTMFYVTNRSARYEAGTRRALERAGFPLPDDRDVVLLRGERDGWTSDKSVRRAAVADSFRVLLVIGDDLNDFLPAGGSLAEREGVAARHADRWGTRWIVVPNPMHGSWESALWSGRDSPSVPEQVEVKRERLREFAF